MPGTSERLPFCYRRLLDYMVQHPGRLVTPQELSQVDVVLADRQNLRVYICKVRKALRDGRILTRYGMGYVYQSHSH